MPPTKASHPPTTIFSIWWELLVLVRSIILLLIFTTDVASRSVDFVDLVKVLAALGKTDGAPAELRIKIMSIFGGSSTSMMFYALTANAVVAPFLYARFRKLCRQLLELQQHMK